MALDKDVEKLLNNIAQAKNQINNFSTIAQLYNQISQAKDQLDDPFLEESKIPAIITRIKKDTQDLIKFLRLENTLHKRNELHKQQAIADLQKIINANDKDSVSLAIGSLVFTKKTILNEISASISESKSVKPLTVINTKPSPIYDTLFALNDPGQRAYMAAGTLVAGIGIFVLALAFTPAASLVPVGLLAASPFILMVGLGMAIFGGVSKLLNRNDQNQKSVEINENNKPVTAIKPHVGKQSKPSMELDVDPTLPSAHHSVFKKPDDKSTLTQSRPQHQPKGPQ